VKKVFQVSAFRRLLAAYALNELTWSVGSLALTVLVYRHTGSALGAAAYFLCAQFVPALFAPWLVSRLDRRPARVVLPALYGIEVVVYCALAWMAGRFSVAPVLALTLIDGAVALTARAIARTATVDVLIPAGLLPEGNAATNAVFSVCYMAGPAIAGVAVATAGASATLVAVAVLFALIVPMLLSTRGLPGPSPARAGGRSAGRLRAAIAYLREQPSALRLLLLQAGAVLFFTISVPVEIVLARRSLHTGDSGYGAMLAAWGAGAVIGSAIYARWRRLSPRALIVAGAGALGLGFLVMAAAPGIVVAIIGSAIAGGGNGVESVAARTALQAQVQDKWMGVMMGLNESVLQAMPGGGILIGGAIAALAGPRAAMAVAGGGALAVTVGAWLLLAPAPARRPPAGTGRGHPPDPKTDEFPTARAAG
jgi:MFS family permease